LTHDPQRAYEPCQKDSGKQLGYWHASAKRAAVGAA